MQRFAANDGFGASELDWVALQRLKKLGLAEDRAAGVRITKDGQRVLRIHELKHSWLSPAIVRRSRGLSARFNGRLLESGCSATWRSGTW